MDGTKTGPDNEATTMRSRFVALRPRPTNHTIPRDEDGVFAQAWLLAEWPTGAAEPTDFWLATLPEATPLSELVRVAKIRWVYRTELPGTENRRRARPFRGSLPARLAGTVVTAANLFLTTLRLSDPTAGGLD